MTEPKYLVLFDGVCNYCNTMVNFAIKNDADKLLKFTPLQGGLAKIYKEKYNISPNIDSVVFIEDGKVKYFADAGLSICKYLNWPAKLLYAFRIFPLFISNPVYKWIAKNRYKWWGQRAECMVPTPNVKERFL
jgi:predicted DCC family thiol-disulfide oxidoreductase YuxK